MLTVTVLMKYQKTKLLTNNMENEHVCTHTFDIKASRTDVEIT